MGGGVWKGGKDEKNAGAAACREAKKDTKERVRKDFFFFSFCHHRDSVDGSLDHSPTPKSPQIRCPGWEDIAECWLHADEKV